MTNYLRDYKSERTHDYNLIELMNLLKEENKEHLFNELIVKSPNDLGLFINGVTKRDFDVLLQFEKAQIVIETKVDSTENKGNTWQTYNIYRDYSERWPDKPKHFLYATYGLTEFYTKKREDNAYGTGSYSSHFKHIKCSDLSTFVKRAVQELSKPPEKLTAWSQWLEFELLKRNDNQEYIGHLAKIIEKYKSGLNLTDYPIKRLNIFVPEFTIPFYYELCTAWNQTNNNLVGRAGLYSLGRGYSPVFDSILNFSELWLEKKPLTCGGIVEGRELYFEFNEDFNLHLKSGSDNENISDTKQFIAENKNALTLDGKYHGVEEHYTQGSYVLFEWDFKLLTKSVEKIIPELKEVLENAITILA